MANNLIHLHTEAKKDHIIIYGAGKFQEEKISLDRLQAAMLFVKLSKFLNVKSDK